MMISAELRIVNCELRTANCLWMKILTPAVIGVAHSHNSYQAGDNVATSTPNRVPSIME